MKGTGGRAGFIVRMNKPKEKVETHTRPIEKHKALVERHQARYEALQEKHRELQAKLLEQEGRETITVSFSSSAKASSFSFESSQKISITVSTSLATEAIVGLLSRGKPDPALDRALDSILCGRSPGEAEEKNTEPQVSEHVSDLKPKRTPASLLFRWVEGLHNKSSR